jgi:DNA-directed RNA polymerase specialized sigma24 family protein
VTHARTPIHSESSHLRALPDGALVDAMREGVGEAWAEFDARFRPLLERYALRVGIPRWEWSVCITEVLDDEALRLVERSRAMPQHLSAYLVRAVHNRHLAVKRAAMRRERRYANAVEAPEDGLCTLISDHTRRSCDPPRLAEEIKGASTGIARFAELLSARLTEDERQMLAWVAEGVPQRVIGEWLGINRDAAKKRITRLCRRLRVVADEVSSTLPPDARREIDRLIQRAAAKGHSHAGASDDG